MDSKYSISFGKGGEDSKWLQPRPFGRLQPFPKARSRGAVFINWARGCEDKLPRVREPTLSGFEPKKPLNQTEPNTNTNKKGREPRQELGLAPLRGKSKPQ